MNALALENKRILVIGSSGLIGAAIAKAVAEAGAHLIVADIKDGTAQINELTGRGLNAEYRHLNISDESNITSFFNNIDTLDGMVNCAYPRTADWGTKFEDATLSSLRTNEDLQLNSVFFCCQLAAHKMVKNRIGGGRLHC